MVMQLQEECQSCDDPLLCSDWLIAARCAAIFHAGTGFCSLLSEIFLASCANWSLHSPSTYSSHLIALLSLGVLLVCVIKVWLGVSTEHDWLCKTSLYSQLCCSNFVEAVGEVGLDCVVLPCCKNIHLVSASKSVTMPVKSFSLFFWYQACKASNWQLICRFPSLAPCCSESLALQALLTSSHGNSIKMIFTKLHIEPDAQCRQIYVLRTGCGRLTARAMPRHECLMVTQSTWHLGQHDT